MYYLTEKGSEVFRRKIKWEVSPHEWYVLEFLGGSEGPQFFEQATEARILDPVVLRARDSLVRKGLAVKED